MCVSCACLKHSRTVAYFALMFLSTKIILNKIYFASLGNVLLLHTPRAVYIGKLLLIYTCQSFYLVKFLLLYTCRSV